MMTADAGATTDMVAKLRQRVTAYTKLLSEPRRVTAAHLEGARNELRDAIDIIEAQSKALAEAREDVAEDDPSTGLAAKFIEGFDVGYREALLAARPTDPAVAVPAAELLAIRDALLAGDLDDAWHHLYTIADPEFCQMEPWRNLEHKARALTPTPENPNG